MKKKKKNFKINSPIKILKVLAISILALIITSSNNNAQANFFNKFKKGFYFEKYSEADRARSEYYKMINYDQKLSNAKNAICKKYGYNQYHYDLQNKKMIKELDEISIVTKEDEENIIKLRNEKNYKDDAMTALLKLHPIGSDVDGLIKTLERAGAENYKPIITEKYKNNPRLKNIYWYKYSHMTLNSFFKKKWGLTIETDKQKLLVLTINFYQGI